jgi:hypothetical protein
MTALASQLPPSAPAAATTTDAVATSENVPEDPTTASNVADISADGGVAEPTTDVAKGSPGK